MLIDNTEVKKIELSNDGKFLWIHSEGVDVKILLQRVIKAIESNEPDTNFDEFWNKYHEVTGLKKTDYQPAKKYWDKLTKRDRKSALDNIENYFVSLPTYSTGKPIKKARTYLADKNFNDEFEVSRTLNPKTLKGSYRSDGKPAQISITDVAVNNYAEFEQYCKENNYNPETGKSLI